MSFLTAIGQSIENFFFEHRLETQMHRERLREIEGKFKKGESKEAFRIFNQIPQHHQKRIYAIHHRLNGSPSSAWTWNVEKKDFYGERNNLNPALNARAIREYLTKPEKELRDRGRRICY